MTQNDEFSIGVLSERLQADLFVPESEPRGERGATRAWDVLMLNAQRQAEDYAKEIACEIAAFAKARAAS